MTDASVVQAPKHSKGQHRVCEFLLRWPPLACVKLARKAAVPSTNNGSFIAVYPLLTLDVFNQLLAIERFDE
jgi:hypothetical protein